MMQGTLFQENVLYLAAVAFDKERKREGEDMIISCVWLEWLSYY